MTSGVSDEEFSADTEWVEKDLRILKDILESNGGNEDF